MAVICKRCRHGRAGWATCGCSWYLRRRVRGREGFIRLGPDRVVAEDAAARLEARLGPRPDARMDALMARWLAGKEAAPGARDNSVASFRARSRVVAEWFGPMPVEAVRAEHLREFAADMLASGRAPATVQGYYAALTSALRMAVAEGLIKAVPAPFGGPGIPEPKPREHRMTLAQVEEVIGLMGGVWADVAELVLLTGLRWGESVALTDDDVDWDRGVLVVRRTRTRRGNVNGPKTDSGTRILPVSRGALAVLGRLELPVGGDYRRARETLNHAMRLAGVYRPGMGWHSVRAAHGSLLDAAGVPVREQARRLGHSHAYAVTLRYGLASEVGSADALDQARHDAGRAVRRRAPARRRAGQG